MIMRPEIIAPVIRRARRGETGCAARNRHREDVQNQQQFHPEQRVVQDGMAGIAEDIVKAREDQKADRHVDQRAQVGGGATPNGVPCFGGQRRERRFKDAASEEHATDQRDYGSDVQPPHRHGERKVGHVHE